MDRRRYLSLACVPLLVGVGGCSGEGLTPSEGTGGDAEGGTGAGGETGEGPGDSPESATAGASDVAGDIWIDVRNTATEGATVRLAVFADGSEFFEAEVEVPENGSRAVDPSIDETGRYRLEVAVEGGPDGSFPFSIGEYDLRMGSNAIVLIEDDDVRITIEE